MKNILKILIFLSSSILFWSCEETFPNPEMSNDDVIIHSMTLNDISTSTKKRVIIAESDDGRIQFSLNKLSSTVDAGNISGELEKMIMKLPEVNEDPIIYKNNFYTYGDYEIVMSSKAEREKMGQFEEYKKNWIEKYGDNTITVGFSKISYNILKDLAVVIVFYGNYTSYEGVLMVYEKENEFWSFQNRVSVWIN